MSEEERWVVLDLPVPLEPVIVDVNRSLAEQLPPGRYLEAAEKMLAELRDYEAAR